MNSQISDDEVIAFANRNSSRSFFTLKQNKPFKIRQKNDGIEILLPNTKPMPANRRHIKKYLSFYDAAPFEKRRKTTIYKDGLREASYMARIFVEIEREKALQGTATCGLDDLDSAPQGSVTPDRAQYSVSIVIRDPKVRLHVIEAAKGQCEFCNKAGFLMANGKRYLEAHHIIALAKDGRDTVENVIALCPEHHRQAHFGVDADKLEKAFLVCISKRVNN